jgi:copper(I)-binding protein
MDAITGVDVPGAGVASLHEHQHDGATGNMRMIPVATYPVAAGATLRLAPGGAHVMIERPARRYRRGERFRLLVRFAHGGIVSAELTVITYADLDTAVAPTAPR